MPEYATDETTARERRAGEPESRPIIFTQMPPSGQSYAGLLASPGTIATGKELLTGQEKPSRPPVAKRLTKDTPGIRLAFESCLDAIEAALENDDDLALKSNAVTDLQEALDRLWQARAGREEQFGDLISHLQGLLLGVPAEDLEAAHLSAIKEVIRRSSHISDLSDADLRDLEKPLIKAGCDVFREMR